MKWTSDAVVTEVCDNFTADAYVCAHMWAKGVQYMDRTGRSSESNQMATESNDTFNLIDLDID